MSAIYEKLEKCVKSVREQTSFIPKIGIVLGSGLGAFAEEIKIEQKIEYTQIEGFPVSTVKGHKGCLVFGYVEDIPVVIMQGRVHFYEGYDIEDVVLPIRLIKMLGANILFLTNAAGGINESYNAGDFMLINDHISSFIKNPLIGSNIDELGVRFPDMSEVYTKELSEIISETAKMHNINLKEGVYLQTTGPAYESPAEIRWL